MHARVLGRSVRSACVRHASRSSKPPKASAWKEARDTAVVTSDEFGEEKRLVWENEADLHQVPMELRALYRQLDSEREEKKAVADEVVKMRDYQFYHETMQARIHAIEERWELSGRPFTDTYRKAVDREIEEAVITTQEEFAAYFKARDERLFALVERRFELLRAGRYDANAMKYLIEAEAEYEQRNMEEVRMLTAGLPPNHAVRSDADGRSDDELDSDEVEEDEGDLLAASKEPRTELDMVDRMIADMKHHEAKQRPLRSQFAAEYKGDDSDPGRLYSGYEDLKLYRRELDESGFASTDRIFAHLKAREREFKRQARLPKEERTMSLAEEEMEMRKLIAASQERLAPELENQREREEAMKDVGQYRIPTANDFKQMRNPVKGQYDSDTLENQRILDTIKRLPSRR